jgi:hypothetical protein
MKLHGVQPEPPVAISGEASVPDALPVGILKLCKEMRSRDFCVGPGTVH